MNASNAQDEHLPLDGQQEGNEREYDVLALMTATSIAGQSLTEIAQFDHLHPPTNSEDLQSRDNALASLLMVRDFLIDSVSASDDEERKRIRANNLHTINNALSGYGYRQANKLPGLSDQVASLRKDMKHIYIPGSQNETGQVLNRTVTAMTHLLQQPDVDEDLIAQLRGEYRMVQDLLEEGVVPDAHELFMETYAITNGIDSAFIPECIDRLYATVSVEARMQKAKPLILLQNVKADIFSLNQAIEHVPEVERSIVHRVAEELKFRRSIYIDRMFPHHEEETVDEPTAIEHASNEDEVLFEMKQLYEVMHEQEPMPTGKEQWNTWYMGHVSRQIALATDVQKATAELDRLQHKPTWKEKIGLSKKIKKQKDILHTFVRLHFEAGEKIEVARYIVQAHTFMETRIDMIRTKLSATQTSDAS